MSLCTPPPPVAPGRVSTRSSSGSRNCGAARRTPTCPPIRSPAPRANRSANRVPAYTGMSPVAANHNEEFYDSFLDVDTEGEASRTSVFSLNNISSLDDVEGVTDKTKFHLRSLCEELKNMELNEGSVPHTLLSIALDEADEEDN